MKIKNDYFVRNIENVIALTTSHGNGTKKILLDTDETTTNITQIAYTNLLCGDVINEHMHPSMEECFFVMEGQIRFCIGKDSFILEEGSFIRISAGIMHALEILQTSLLLTIGIAI